MVSPRASSAPQPGRGLRQYLAGSRVPGTVYDVVKVLGVGGMGTVYEVEDTSVGKRYVLKTLHPELGDRQDLARRMQNEARTLARLQHPNIVEVVTAGVTSDELKLPFYVMERLEGQNIRVVIEKMRRLSVAHAVRIAIDLLDALDRAHESGVIHRDVKPDNIFLHRAPSGSTVTKLLDFGIMRLLDGSRGDTAGRFLGTLRYAAPEQLRGETLSAQTDLYAAGLVLYEMVAGRGPFDHLGDAQQIGRAHLKEPPPLLSRFAPEAPPKLVQLVDQALSKDPTLRPRDAFTFAGELRGLQKVLRAPPPFGGSAPTTSATEVNVLGSIETVAETSGFAPLSLPALPGSIAPPPAARVVRAASPEVSSSAPTEAAGLELLPTEQDVSMRVGSSEAGLVDAEPAASSAARASSPEPATAPLLAAEVASVVIDRHALTHTSAAAEVGAVRGTGDTEAYVLPGRNPAAAPASAEQPGSSSFAAPGRSSSPLGRRRADGGFEGAVASGSGAARVESRPSEQAERRGAPSGRNDPTVRRGRRPGSGWIAGGALAVAAAFGLYRLETGHADGKIAPSPSASLPGAAVAPVPPASASSLPLASASAATPATPATSAPPVVNPAEPASPGTVSPASAPPPAPAVRTAPPARGPAALPPATSRPSPRAPVRAPAGPPRVSSGI